MPLNQLHEYRIAALVNTLRTCQLFAGLPPADLKQIADISVLRNLEKEEYLFREGEPAQGFYVVQKGAVNVHRVTAAGKEQVIHIFRTGESFAEGAVATATGYPADARAIEPTTVTLVKKEDFIGLLRKQPQLALRMLASMSQHLRILIGLVEDLTLKDVETRLAHWLMKRCPNIESNDPHTIELSLTKRMLAAELGTVSETFSRTLAKFRYQKLITVKGKMVTIASPAKLNALLKKNLEG